MQISPNNPANRIIQRFGGITQSARAWGKAKSTVQRWKDSGFIHPDYYPGILEAAVVEKVHLDARDFNPVDINHPAFSEPKTASPDSTAGHAAGSSANPIPDTELSPQLDAAPEQSDGTADGGNVSSSSDPHLMA